VWGSSVCRAPNGRLVWPGPRGRATATDDRQQRATRVRVRLTLVLQRSDRSGATRGDVQRA
jgi:hypothetical protein